MREPLLLPLIAVCAGILVSQYVPFGSREAAIPALLFAACSLVRVSPWLRRLTATLSLIFAGVFLVAWHRPSVTPFIDAGLREVVVMEGCVVEPTLFSDDRAQFTVELSPGARARVSAPSRAVGSGQELTLAYGQRIEMEARIRPPHNFENPGAFDYTAYLAQRDIFWTALVPSGGEVRVLPGNCGSAILAAIFRMRTAALERIDELYTGDNYASAMLEAVLIGESRHLERVWTEDFRRSGTYHALVISGLHISVLAGVLLFLLRAVPISKNKALLLTAAVAWIYAAVSGFSAPVVRAAAGFTLYVIAQGLFRRTRPLNLLAAIALGFLAWNPSQLLDASFQLSFLSVAAIAALAVPLVDSTIGPYAFGLRQITNVEVDPKLEPRIAQFRVELRLVAETISLWTRIPLRWATEALAVAGRGVLLFLETGVISAAIQVGLALPMALYFHRLSFTGITANLLVVPLMNAVVPLGFLAVFTQWHWAAALTETLVRWSASIAQWHAKLEPAWRVPDPPLWLAVGFVAALVLLAVVVRKPPQPVSSKQPEPQPPIQTFGQQRLPLEATVVPGPSSKFAALRAALRWPALTVVLTLLGLLIWSPWKPRIEAGLLEVTAIDVGQGDSILVVFPQGLTMLIDGGGRLDFGRRNEPQPRMSRMPSNLDIGEDVVSSYLWTRGIRNIDILVATHAHQDHIGGLASLINNFHPTQLWTGANPPVALVAQARQLGVRVEEKRSGKPFPMGGALAEILAPTSDYFPAPDGTANNNDSLVLMVTLGTRSFLLTGDLESSVEFSLLTSGAHLKADVLKVGHHGSKTSTTEEFLDAVAPSVALVSAGYDNSFGHPHPDVLARLQSRGTAILRTDLDGLATVRTDGKDLRWGVHAWEPRPLIIGMPVNMVN